MGVIGTAGHVDHGKSTLVRALTGIDPDRLKEEKQREMTIDLGFAWLDVPGLPDPVGIVDVPGHRDFVENMLAGVGGIDAVLFVVAADEGIMPQTREHLAIVDLLGIPGGLVVLTKIDLAPDEEWIQLVEMELTELLVTTPLAKVPMVRVAARQGQGIEALRAHIARLIRALPASPDLGKPRLWIDRVFSASGFGTVVTGTLLGGSLAVGQELEIAPDGLRARVRGLQNHHRPLENAHPGSRLAVNLSGVDRDELRRGHLLSLPGVTAPTRLAAVRFRHLADAPRPLKHNAEVKCFVGAAETVARVRLLEGDQLLPGAMAWLQLELRDPLPLSRGDRFILRYPSPGETIGGGDVIEPEARRAIRHGKQEAVARLEALAGGDLPRLMAGAANRPQRIETLAAQLDLDEDAAAEALEAALAARIVLDLGDGWWLSLTAFDHLLERVGRVLGDFHQAEPMRPGLRPERLRSALGLENVDPAGFAALIGTLTTRGLIQVTRSRLIALAGHTVRWSKAQRAAVERLLRAFAESPYTPPSPKEAAEQVGADVLAGLLEMGELRQIAPDVLLSAATCQEWLTVVRETLEQAGRIDVRALRDRFSTSRKYALGFLEYLGNLGLTRRDGDDHVLASTDWSRAE